MRHIISGAILALLFSSLVLTSCGGSGNNSENFKEDSIRRADSIRNTDAILAEKAAEAAIEQALLDSLRQDSIQKADVEAFRKVLPSASLAIGNFDWASSIGSKLKAMGYTGSTKKSPDEYDTNITGKYSITVGDKSCTIKFESNSNIEFGHTNSQITIKGDNEALNNLYKEINNYVRKKGWVMVD